MVRHLHGSNEVVDVLVRYESTVSPLFKTLSWKDTGEAAVLAQIDARHSE